jgi:hypothetical protein
MKFATEQELAETIVDFLHDMKWDVYQEVLVAGRVLDIVAIQNKISWVIEVKLSLSLNLIAQIFDRKHYGCANYYSIAIPQKRWSKSYQCGEKILRDAGIGMLTSGSSVREIVPPKICRKTFRDMSSIVRPEHKVFAKAGSANGGYFTPFKNTCNQVVYTVKDRPGLTLKDLIDSIDHHYHSTATANSSIKHFIENGVIPGVEVRKEGRYLRIYPTGGEPSNG